MLIRFYTHLLAITDKLHVQRLDDFADYQILFKEL